MRDSELNTDSGHDRVELRASTRAGEFDPAFGMENSVLNTGDDNDQVRISADARGNTTDTIAAYGALNSQIDTGNDDDRLEISATANNRNGYAEAVGLDSSTANTGSGDDDVRIRAHADGLSTNAWAMRDSELNTDSGHDRVDIQGNALRSRILTGDGGDTVTISGHETNQVHVDTGASDDTLKVDGGTAITYVTGDGSDQLELTRNYFTSLVEAGKADKGVNQGDPLMVEDFTTGAGGDSFNCDDILLGHAVGLKRQSVFADGFLSIQQQGKDSILFFDADGADKQASSELALVVFKGVQAAEFSTENLDSRLINHDDFLLSQHNQKGLDLTSEVFTGSSQHSHGISQPQPWQAVMTEMDPLELHNTLQPSNELV